MLETVKRKEVRIRALGLDGGCAVKPELVPYPNPVMTPVFPNRCSPWVIEVCNERNALAAQRRNEVPLEDPFEDLM